MYVSVKRQCRPCVGRRNHKFRHTAEETVGVQAGQSEEFKLVCPSMRSTIVATKTTVLRIARERAGREGRVDPHNSRGSMSRTSEISAMCNWLGEVKIQWV